MHDPMALVTDYAMALVAAGLSIPLWRRHRMWSLAFLFTALGAAAGGTFHGLFPSSVLLWKSTVFSVGLASFFLLAGCDRRMTTIAVLKLVLYMSWMIGHDAFVYVIVDYGLTLILIAVTVLMRRSQATPWVLASIAASVAGALVQQFRVTLDPHWFDYNDLYHVIQIAALWMLYRAGMTMQEGGAEEITTSSTARSTIPPT